MIAPLVTPVALTRRYRDFLVSLKDQGFRGEISPDYGNRTVLATDNSIYQRLPQAALFPGCTEKTNAPASAALWSAWASG
ncbi:hypothetical protein D9M68_596800 [compost metagenome]